MKTTVITGASSGIGKAFALYFAEHNISDKLILIARRTHLLHSLADQISRVNSNIETIVYSMDLLDENNRIQLFNEVEEADCIINNAGFGDFADFSDSEWEKQSDMIDLNIKALTHLTHGFLPQMIARNNGAIINIASVAAFQPGPKMSVYFATKAYVLSLSEAINYELRNTNVKVFTVCPGPTESEFHEIANSLHLKVHDSKMPTAKELVEDTMEHISGNQKSIFIHGKKNKIGSLLSRFLPRSIVLKITDLLLK